MVTERVRGAGGTEGREGAVDMLASLVRGDMAFCGGGAACDGGLGEGEGSVVVVGSSASRMESTCRGRRPLPARVNSGGGDTASVGSTSGALLCLFFSCL